MKLKELEIFGFKSFADRTYIRFDEGITVVVGPNGSGKSNIFDSIRWVLGSQSAKSLRGSKMEDVIFIGSDDRKTLGMAEVSLTFLNNDRSLNIDYEEVKVTRRLYRSGESEYFINDNPVRLKDILELFMDTGVGIDSYSIISQGEVDRIINAKPVERREIFEEAAGITKYIKKRDEALRKLEATEQNMLRINDILVEVKRQTASLERQAKKAEKYKEIKEEWSSIAVRLLTKELKDRTLKNRELESENGEVERRIEEENTKLSTHEMKFEEMKLLSIEREREINEKKEKWLIRQQEIKRLEDNLKFLSQRHVELSQRIEELRAQNVENVGKIEGIKVEINDKTRVLSEITDKINFRQEALNVLTAEYDGLVLSFEEARRLKERNAQLVQQKTLELNTMVNKIVEAESSLRNIDETIKRHEDEKKALEDRARAVNAELSRLSENRGFKEGEIKKIKDREEVLIKEKILKSESLDIIDNILKELNLGISRMESRHSFLRQLHERMEGFGETVRKVLTEYKDTLSEDKKEDIVDVVANLIAVEKPYEAAVEKTLTGILQTVLVRNESVITDVFNKYRESKGEISLVNGGGLKVDTAAVLERFKGLVRHQDVLAYLPDVITVEPKNEAVKLLFSNIYTVESIEKADEVFAAFPVPEEYFLLTLNGELISNFSVYKRGESTAETGGGFLSREREINEINNEILMAREKYASVDEERQIQAAKLADIQAEIEDLSSTYHNRYVEVVKDDERIRQKEEDKEIVAVSLTKVDEQKVLSETEKKLLLNSTSAIKSAKETVESGITSLRQAVDNSISDIAAKEEELNASKHNLEEKRMEIMKIKNDFEVEQNSKEMLSGRLEEIQKYYENTAHEIEEMNAKAQKAESDRTESELKIEADKKALGSDESEYTERKVSYDQYRGEMSGLESYIKEMGKDRDSLRQRQYDLKIKMNEISLNLGNLQNKLAEEFKVQPDEQTIMAVEIPDEEHEAIKLRVEELKDKMDKMGVINLVAIEEYNELTSRQQFLQVQYDDLASGRENLKKVIKKTNDESKQLFTKAFSEVRVKFAEVFTRMMNGGEADLVLVDQENILESGVDIIAKPPGKKSQNITLLSGGEKAITAVSLLFALFLTRTSPFCIMDEVDAALDDMNIARFTNLIRSFSDITQFLIISHNKITMEIARTIYGVSMESAGVSKIISVKLEGKEGGIDAKAGAELREKEKGKVRTRAKYRKERMQGFIDVEKLDSETLTERAEENETQPEEISGQETAKEDEVISEQEVIDEQVINEEEVIIEDQEEIKEQPEQVETSVQDEHSEKPENSGETEDNK